MEEKVVFDLSGKFREAFDYFNEKLFDTRLPQVVITTQKHRGAAGFFLHDSYCDRAFKEDGTRDASPEGGQDGISPVYDLDVAFTVDSADYLACHFFGFKHHGVMEISFQQVGVNETRTDVCESDFQPTGISLLLQRLQIDVLHCLSG